MGAPKGNSNARRAARWRDALERAESHLDGEVPGSTLFKLGLNVWSQALAGDKDAIEEIANRYDGKPTNTIAGDPDAPLTFQEIAVRAIDATGS